MIDMELNEKAHNFVRILILGDVVGRAGRKLLKQKLSEVKTNFDIDLCLINAENLAGGFGITYKVFNEIRNYGVNLFTMGNHWADKADVHSIYKENKELIIPHNITSYNNLIMNEYEFANIYGYKYKIGVVNLLGTFGMKVNYTDLFNYLSLYKEYLIHKRKYENYIILADIHAEASSEKQAVFYFLDNIASCIYGTHTHVPTSDERISVHGTSYITDVGMTGAYESIIGMDVKRGLQRYFSEAKTSVLEVAEKNLWFTGIIIDVDINTGETKIIYRIQWREYNEKWVINMVEK